MQIFISVHLAHTKHSKNSNAVQSKIFNLWEASNEKPQKEERVYFQRENKVLQVTSNNAYKILSMHKGCESTEMVEPREFKTQ